MASMTFELTGDLTVQVTVTETADGGLQFDLAVLDGALIGDLQGLFFDLADDSLVSGLSVVGNEITDDQFRVDSVTNLGQGVNVNGEIVNEYGAFDAGVQIGTQGISRDDIQNTSFTLYHDSQDLTLADVSLQDFAVRLTSVGEEDGSRDGSLKIGGVSGEEPDGEVDPGTDPDGDLDPGTDPDGEVDPGTDPDGDLDPGTDPDGELDPGTQPDGELDPGTQPDGELDPGTFPDDTFIFDETAMEGGDTLEDPVIIDASAPTEPTAEEAFLDDTLTEGTIIEGSLPSDDDFLF